MLSRFIERGVDGNEITLRQKLFETDDFNSFNLRLGPIDWRHNIQPQSFRFLRNPLSDISQTNDAQSLPFQTSQRWTALQLINPLLRLMMIKRDLPAQSQNRSDRMFGNFDQTIVGNVRDRYWVCGTKRNINII